MVEPGKMICEERDVRPPADGEVLVKTSFGSICGSDLHLVLMEGIPVPEVQLPGFPGHEGVGEIVESRHAEFTVGQRVLTVPNAFVGTCFAEYQTLSPSYCVPLRTDGADIKHQLMAQQLGTVIYALRQYPHDVGRETVVVLGQGSAGLFFTYMMKRAGAATVIASELSSARRAVSAHMGADMVVDPDEDDLLDVVMDHTEGRGADYLVEAVGRREALLVTPELVRADAEMLWFGLPDSSEPVPLNFSLFFMKRLSAHCTFGAQDEPDLVSFAVAADLIERGEIDVSPLVSHVLPIEDIDEAFHLAYERGDDAVKVSIGFD